MTFDMPAGSKVLIYGAGKFGREVYEKIKNIYSVVCFIDKNKHEIENIDMEVRALNGIAEYRECIVLVCVHNGGWHREIAEELYEVGFEKILFLALCNVYRSEKAALMNRVYNLFLEEQYGLLKQIPCYSTMLKRKFEERIIRKNSAYVVAYCYKEFLYSYKDGDEVYVEEFSTDAPIVAVKLYMDLFRFFLYGEGKPDQYVRAMKNVNNSFHMSDEEFLKDQYLIYEILENSYSNGEVEAMPIDVKWNQHGYFNILDGHHRCAFYILKGIQKLPVRMRREDYDIWVNNTILKKVEAVLMNKQLLPAVRINHPILMECDCLYNEYETTTLDVLQEWLYSSKRAFSSVLELSPYQAYLGQNFYKMRKVEKITSIVRNKEEAELARLLCALQYIPEKAIEIEPDLNEQNLLSREKYEIGLLCNIYDLEELRLKFGIVNDSVEKMLFWQSKYNAEAEKEYILENSKFGNYMCLASKCLEGRYCEIGIFSC